MGREARSASDHKWDEKHARVGLRLSKTKKEKNRPKNLRECGSGVHKWAEKHARVGFDPV